MRAFRALHKSIESRQSEFKTVCEENRYNMEFIADQGNLKLKTQKRKREEEGELHDDASR